MRYQFIKDNLGQFHLKAMCRVLGVSRSGFYGWLGHVKSQREKDNEDLLLKIKDIFKKSHKTYGSKRVHEQLVSQSEKCSKNRVTRLMKKAGIKAKAARKFVVTTNSDHILPVAENILNRNFTVDAPNKVWLADITYVPTSEGWLYFAGVMDLYNKAIVGWSMGERMGKELVGSALDMAVLRRSPSPGLLHHSDRGS